MYRWCGYCQRFLQERAPYDVFDVTHGICEACIAAGVIDSADAVARVRPIKQFLSEILDLARNGDRIAPESVTARGAALGLRPIDLLVGILQPTLYEVGRAWERGELTPEREALFSQLCDDVVSELASYQKPMSEEMPLFFLMNAHWNRHTVGLRMAAFMLREAGTRVEVLSPTPPLGDLRTLIRERAPAIIGVSLATEWQLPFLTALRDVLPAVGRPRVVVGGGAVRRGCELPDWVEDWSRA